MTRPAIDAVGLGKRYRIGGPRIRAKTLGDRVVDLSTAPIRRARGLLAGDGYAASDLDRSFWALRDVTFQVQHGDVVGIIGSNGAGKSTLLRILSRITAPTSGHADVSGRVGALLEVGTGLHPELTGRENIFLNGAILGMRKKEIERKLDEIIDFAEIETFIDTPVKHYSSGMYVRLAFAIAAHLEPEILVVDEVLAVGDVAFQKKCLGKMESVSREGRTVLFVSHNMGLVRTLCDRGVLLSEGGVAVDASIEEAVDVYLRSLEQQAEIDLTFRGDRRGAGEVRLTGVEIQGAGAPLTLVTGETAHFSFHFDGASTVDLNVYFIIYDQFGQAVTHFYSAVPGPEDRRESSTRDRAGCEVEALYLLSGRYRVDVGIFSDGVLQDHIDAAAFFDVLPGNVAGRAVTRDLWPGNVSFPSRWSLPG